LKVDLVKTMKFDRIWPRLVLRLGSVLKVGLLTTALGFGTIGWAASGQAESVKLVGAGATASSLLYRRYIMEMRQALPNYLILYRAIGSTAGIRQVRAGTVDFGGTDRPLEDRQSQQGVILVPTAGVAVAVVYNLPSSVLADPKSQGDSLRLSRSALTRIFLGQVDRWNDPEIQRINPGLTLPNEPIVLVTRLDDSGTSYIFTNHLSAINPVFERQVGASDRPNWPIASLKGRGNAGVAELISKTPYTIGYVDYDTAVVGELKVAQIQNRQDQYSLPSPQEANRAIQSFALSGDGQSFNPDPAEGYPITGLTWLIVYQRYDDPQKARAIRDIVDWILTEGQKLNLDLNYAPIPDAVAQQVRDQVRRTVKPD